MRKIFILFIALICAVNLFSQSSKTDAMLFGDVKDQNTGEHIPFATITVKGTKMGTRSDVTGHYKLAHLPLGKQIIVASSDGYKSKEIEVTMVQGKSTEIFFELEEDAFNLEQVVVTGTRTPHHIKNVPIRTEVVTAQALKNKNAWNVFEALEGVSGIRVENQCQFCNFTMVRMQGLGAEHTQVLINGQPIYSGLASVYGLEQIGTGDIDRIEVVKGAGSALYGSSAVAGAINIITKEPSLVPSISADVQFGSYGTNVYNLNGSIRNEKGNIGLNVYAQKIDHGIIDQTSEGNTLAEVKKKDNISDRVASNLHNFGFSLYADNPFFSDDRLIIRGKAINEKRAGGTITDDLYKNPFTEGTENITTNRYEAELTYIKPLGEKTDITFTTAYINHNREATNDSYLGDYMSVHNDSTPDVQSMRPYIAKENTLVSTLTLGTQLGRHNLLFGVQNYMTRLNETGLYIVVDKTSPYYKTSYKSTAYKQAHEIGAFVQDEWNINSKLTVVPGVRFDYHSSGEEYLSDSVVFDKAFPKTSFKQTTINPRLAIRYNLNEHITLRANAGTGFRAPYGFSEDLHLCSGSPRVWKSPDLRPEKSYSGNLSADYYGHHFQISGNLFYTYLKDKIDFDDASSEAQALGYTYQWNNIDDATVAGVELSILMNPVRDLNIGLDFTFNDGRYRNVRAGWDTTSYREISRYIPRFAQTTGGVKVEYSPKSWFFSVNADYQGKMYIDYNSEENPETSKIKQTKPYILVNAKVSKSLGQIFNLYVGCKNIFSYIQDEKHLDDAAFIYAPLYGAMFYGGLSIKINP